MVVTDITPFFLQCHRLMMKITGQHPAEDLLLSAAMPQSTDLRQIGLVDDIVEKPGPRDVGMAEMGVGPVLTLSFDG